MEDLNPLKFHMVQAGKYGGNVKIPMNGKRLQTTEHAAEKQMRAFSVKEKNGMRMVGLCTKEKEDSKKIIQRKDWLRFRNIRFPLTDLECQKPTFLALVLISDYTCRRTFRDA